ncbi:MAG: hypothetical protein GYB33_16595 [Gammaproteobacteria bacterium]|nr:hypothetical protein [Gammaproteobacteria bacterium]
MSLTNLLRRLFSFGRCKKAAVLGVGYQEYQLAQALESDAACKVLFFIDENPWNYRNKMLSGEVRSLSDLEALCVKHGIDSVYYCDEDWLSKLDGLSLPPVQSA